MNVVLKPRSSEKAYTMSQNGVFVFVVPSELNKQQIKQAIETTYDISVTKVTVMNQKGKTKRVYQNKRFVDGTRKDVKKAYVTLKDGQSIPVFAAVEESTEA